jgi:hypothetical protein
MGVGVANSVETGRSVASAATEAVASGVDDKEAAGVGSGSASIVQATAARLNKITRLLCKADFSRHRIIT